jgi:branched-chain amino acid transport system substrate-binding protein
MLAVVAQMSQQILAKSAVPRGWLTAYVKDPTDPQWQDTPEYNDWLAWMKKYNTSGNVSDIFAVYGYSAAQTMVAVLKQCGDDLTSENVMKQAANIHDLKLPMLLPGTTVSTSAH